MTFARANTITWLIFIALIVIITYLTLKPHNGPQFSNSYVDKVEHFIAFFVLVLPPLVLRPRRAWWIIPAVMLFGATIEIIQPSFGRGREVADFFADGLGALCGAAVSLAMNRAFSGRLARSA
jgi:VanZ family protein